MSGPSLLQITDGKFALSLVNTAATGYSDDWQAPGGKTVMSATLADYTGSAASWACQVTDGRLTPSKQSTTREIPATFCSPASSEPEPGVTTYTLDVEYLQDPQVVDGISAMLYANDTLEAYFYLAASGTGPRAVGRCILVAGTFLGAPRANLTDSVSLDLVRRADILFGATTAGRVVEGAGTTYTVPV